MASSKSHDGSSKQNGRQDRQGEVTDQRQGPPKIMPKPPGNSSPGGGGRGK